MHLKLLNHVIFWAIILVQSFSLEAKSSPTLSATGLYSNIAKFEIANGVEEYTVLYPLWSDGEVKKRWMLFPPGAQIDTSDGNWWKFPVGTKIWKEFGYMKNGTLKRIETRMMFHGSKGWEFSTYLWNTTDSEAYVSNGGRYPNYLDLGNGVYHHIPSLGSCTTCHFDTKNESPVIGFAALQLSHSEPGLNLNKLQQRALLTHELPKNISIKSTTPEGAKAIGLIHGNCAHCHNPRGQVSELSMNLRHNINTTLPTSERAYITTVNQDARYSFPDPEVSFKRVLPKYPEKSILYRRIKASQHQDVFYSEKMPPGDFGNMSVNQELLLNLEKWIKHLP